MIIISFIYLGFMLSCTAPKPETPAITTELVEVSSSNELISESPNGDKPMSQEKELNVTESSTRNGKIRSDEYKLKQTAGQKAGKEQTASANDKASVDEVNDDSAARVPAGEVKVAAVVPVPKSQEPKPEGHVKLAFLPLDHTLWQQLLSKYVSNTGVVNYQGLKKDESTLDTYLRHLSDHVALKDASRAQKMAFWINVYNAYTLKLILTHYPVKSIREISSGKPWDDKWIKLGDKIYSLNQIEHEILRAQYRDARIHFAVNCAAKSCPKLSNTAFTEGNLESQLEIMTSSFVNDSAQNKISDKKLELSSIFDWYKDDFGNVIGFINKYSKIKVDLKAKVSFLAYDWALNDK